MRLASESLTDLANALAASAKKQRAGRYRVHRGPVSWAAWPFDVWPFGWTIEFAEAELFEEMGNSVQVSMELVTRAKRGREIELDDGILESFRTDAMVALLQAADAVNAKGDSVVLGSTFFNVRAGEMFDPTASVQGIVVSCDCKV